MQKHLLDKHDTAILLALAGFLALGLGGEFSQPGGPLEEGLLLTLPNLMLHGARMYRDFNFVYGPGDLWVLSAAYAIFGSSIIVERLLGFTYQLAMVFVAYSAGRLINRPTAVATGIVAMIFSMVLMLTALPWLPAATLGLASVILLARARTFTQDTKKQTRFSMFGGLLAGMSILFRSDLALAVVPMILVLTIDRKQRQLCKTALGSFVGISAIGYGITVLTSGLKPVLQALVIDPFIMSAGNHLPIPPPTNYIASVLSAITPAPPWPLPVIHLPIQLTIWFFLDLVGILLFISLSLVTARNKTNLGLEPRVVFALSILGTVAFAQVIERADSYHFAEASVLIVPIAIILITSNLRVLRLKKDGTRQKTKSMHKGQFQTMWVKPCLILVPSVIFGILVPSYTLGVDAHLITTTFGISSIPSAHVNNKGRWFIVAPPNTAPTIDHLLARVNSVTQPGDRLLVGPDDLSRTPYNDAYLYYLLPSLQPSTTFINMYPYIGLHQSKQLAINVENSDVVILDSAWSNWREPNASSLPGPNTVPMVLDSNFCVDGQFGTFQLLLHSNDPRVNDPVKCIAPTFTTN